MDAMSKPEGYECEFVDQVPEDYFCKQCKHVAREPNITSCCGEVLCKGCVDFILQDKESCPSCEDMEISSVPHVKYQRKILTLGVHCAMKDRGCQWTGQLQHLDVHSHVTNGDCQYVDVDCPKQCDQKVQKHNVDTHLADHCPNRDYICQHCNFKETFRVVSEHFEVCPYYPLACSNRCGVSFERGDLEDHMRMCRLEEVQCVFSDAGCQAKFIRDNEDEHMEQNTQKHLALMAATTLRIGKDFERKLQEQQEVFEKKLQDKDEQITVLQDSARKLQDSERKLQEQQDLFEKKLQDKDEQVEQKLDKQSRELQTHLEKNDEQIKAVQDLERKLQEQQQDFQHKQEVFEKKLQDKDEQIKTVHEQLQTTSQILKQQQQDAVSQIRREVGIPPYDITLSNYLQLKTSHDRCESPPMYTHPNGYKFRLIIYSNGISSGICTHVSVWVYSLKSDHDVVLQFPVQFTITLQLLNQHRDQHHYTRDIQCEKNGREDVGDCIGANFTFIPHTDLKWKSYKQTQYLKDDCLRFRITKIIIQ